MKTQFETEECSRCRGSGRYSFCQDYKDRCFKCAGAKVTLTKRGSMAHAYFNTACIVSLSSLKVGDRISRNAFTDNGQQYSYDAVVLEIRHSENLYHFVTGFTSTSWYPIVITTMSPKYGTSSMSAPENSTVRIYRSDDATRLQDALVYQASLNKNGTVKKRKRQDLKEEAK